MKKMEFATEKDLEEFLEKLNSVLQEDMFGDIGGAPFVPQLFKPDFSEEKSESSILVKGNDLYH